MLKGFFSLPVLQGGFNPLSLSPFLWYSGRSLVSGDIATWEDEIGTNDATQSNASLRPSVSTLNTKNAALFASGDYIVAPNVFPKDLYTKLALIRLSTITSTLNNILSGTNHHAMRIIDNGDGTGRLRVLQGTGGNAVNTLAPALAINTNYIVTASYSSALQAINAYVNGAFAGNLLNPTSGTDVSLNIGGFNGAGSLEGRIGEAFIFNKALTGKQGYDLHSWLNSYYGLGLSESLPLLTGIGGSWMQGYGVTGGGTTSGGDGTTTGDTLLAKLLPNLKTSVLAYNDGFYSQTIATLLTVNTVFTRFTYLAPKHICIFWITSNDLNSGVSAATVYANIVTEINRLKLCGYDYIFVMPILPRDTAQGAYETSRATINTDLQNNAASLGITYIDLFSGDGAILNNAAIINNTTYYQADKVHLTATAYSLIETIVRPYINAVL